MDEDLVNSRLSRISTVWTMLAKAHEGCDVQAATARLAFVQRYQRAAYRYLLGALRNPDAADELFQELALRFVRGDFRHADPQRGRFRNYLKTTLSHLVTDYHKRLRRQPQLLDSSLPLTDNRASSEEEGDDPFLTSWREELLDLAWHKLERAQSCGGQPYYSILRYRAEHPQASSSEMAEQLSSSLQRPQPFTETSVRKSLQRAREQFADHLLDEVAASLQHPNIDDIEQELIELDLLRYCLTALQRRRDQLR